MFGDGVRCVNGIARGDEKSEARDDRGESDESRGECGEAEDGLEVKAAAKAAPGLVARRVANGVAPGRETEEEARQG